MKNHEMTRGSAYSQCIRRRLVEPGLTAIDRRGTIQWLVRKAQPRLRLPTMADGHEIVEVTGNVQHPPGRARITRRIGIAPAHLDLGSVVPRPPARPRLHPVFGADVPKLTIDGRQTRHQVRKMGDSVVAAPGLLMADIRRQCLVADAGRAVQVCVHLVANLTQPHGEERADGRAERVTGQGDFVVGKELRGGKKRSVDGRDDLRIGEEEAEVRPAVVAHGGGLAGPDNIAEPISK